jgi:hypothetical protein
MSNAAASVTAVFTYTVTFKQVGIPAGVSWGVTVGVTHYTSTTSSITVSGLSGSVSYAFDASVPAPGGSYTCASGCSGSVTGPTTLTATYQVQLVVVLQYPRNGATVKTANVGFSGTVKGLRNAGIAGATVKVYANGALACTVSTSLQAGLAGQFTCVVVNPTPGLYTWYATATATGYAPGTSPTWSFTKALP